MLFGKRAKKIVFQRIILFVDLYFKIMLGFCGKDLLKRGYCLAIDDFSF